MTESDSDASRPYSFLNIAIISVCFVAIGYGVYYYETTPISEDDIYIPVPTTTPPLVERPPNNDVDKNISATQDDEHRGPLEEAENTTITIEPQIALAESDAFVLITTDKFSQINLINMDKIRLDIIRNTVVFIDNFSRGDVINRFSPLVDLEASFSVEQVEKELYIAPTSFNRYDAYTDYVTSIDPKALATHYQSLKPLIDEAYQEISRPNTRFEDTLNQAIELVLNTPVIEQPIKVVSPSVMYLYDDPELESLNDAQKLMLRMGAENLLKIKATLRSIQTELNLDNE